MSELAVLVPVLRRPHRVKPLLLSLKRTGVPYLVYFIVDPDDEAEKEAIRDAKRDDLSSEVVWIEHQGNYASKINTAVQRSTEPFLFLGADDLDFHPGWFEAAKAKMVDGIGVVGTRDLCNKQTETGELATHSLVARWYCGLGTIDEPDKLLHDGYPHEFVDAEFTHTAKYRGMYAHAPGSVVEHLHPDAGKAPIDALYAARPLRMSAGRRLYRRRSHLWT